MSDIVILSGVRTAIGTFGGALAAVPPITLGATAAEGGTRLSLNATGFHTDGISAAASG